jgi:excisionase family DNA binding protein
MKKEILNLEFNNACLVVKAINWKGCVKDAAKVLGVCDTTVYEIIRRNHIEIVKNSEGRMYVNTKKEIVYRDDKGKTIRDIPF